MVDKNSTEKMVTLRKLVAITAVSPVNPTAKILIKKSAKMKPKTQSTIETARIMLVKLLRYASASASDLFSLIFE